MGAFRHASDGWHEWDGNPAGWDDGGYGYSDRGYDRTYQRDGGYYGSDDDCDR